MAGLFVRVCCSERVCRGGLGCQEKGVLWRGSCFCSERMGQGFNWIGNGRLISAHLLYIPTVPFLSLPPPLPLLTRSRRCSVSRPVCPACETPLRNKRTGDSSPIDGEIYSSIEFISFNCGGEGGWPPFPPPHCVKRTHVEN